MFGTVTYRRAAVLALAVAAVGLTGCTKDDKKNPPAAPASLTATATSPTAVSLVWEDASSNETGFVVEQAADAAFTAPTPTSLAANVATLDVTGLTTHTAYYFRVKALNGDGSSAWVTASVTTLPAAPTVTTVALTTALATDSATVTWTDAAANSPSPVTGYVVEWSLTSGGTPVSSATITGASTLTTNVTGLTAGTQYFFRVRTVSAAGTSAWSNVVAVTTHVAAPSAPVDSTTVVSTPADVTVTLSWTAPAGGETGFRIERSTDDFADPANTVVLETVSGTTYTDTGVVPSTTYYYRIVATNGLDAVGTVSVPVTTLPLQPPAAPTGLTAVASGSGDPVVPVVVLTWTDASSNEAGFKVYRAPDVTGAPGTWVALGSTDTTPLAAGTQTFTDSTLVAADLGVTYWYRVAASNATADVNCATDVSVTPALPGTPAALVAVAQSATSILLTWGDVSGETSYVIQRTTDDPTNPAAVWANVIATAANPTAADVVSFLDDSVVAGTIYYYRVAAVNAVGTVNSTASASVTTNTPANVVNLVATAGTPADTVIHLTWVASANATGYRVERSDTSGGTFVAVGGTDVTPVVGTSFNDTGLTASTTYYYRVVALNGLIPAAAASNEATLLTSPPLPTQVVNLVHTAQTTGTIALAWDNSANETGYRVERAPDNNGTAGTFAPLAGTGTTPLQADSVTFTDSTVAEGTIYHYRVIALQNAIEAPPSAALRWASQPEAPTVNNLVEDHGGGNRGIDVSWADGSAVDNTYLIDRSVNGANYATVATLPINTTTWRDIDRDATHTDVLTVGATYQYRVYAVVVVGSDVIRSAAAQTNQVTW